MNNNIKVGVGFLIPAAAIIAFFFSIFTENYLLGIVLSISGVLLWFIYAAVMQSELPNVTGNIIIVFGVLLSLAVFLNYGWEQNMFGGFNFNPEGAAGSAVLLFFSVLLGVLFRNKAPVLAAPSSHKIATSPEPPAINVAEDEKSDDDAYLSYYNGEYDDYYPEDYEEYYPDYYEYYGGDEDEE
ncbi:hypothetical protein JYT44_00055 [Caldithrix abyssi]|nr:hypothetical protein [Caldithrix abyssi]